MPETNTQYWLKMVQNCLWKAENPRETIMYRRTSWDTNRIRDYYIETAISILQGINGDNK